MCCFDELHFQEEAPWDKIVKLTGKPKVTTKENPLTKQVGGSHYKDLKIQPIEYILANGLGFCEGNIIKYITRWKQKGGIQDIDKVIHYAELLKQEISKSD